MTNYYKKTNNYIDCFTTEESIAQKQGMPLETEENILYGYDGNLYLESELPTPSVDYQNEQIRMQRQARYVAESDPIRLDYDEALARGEETAEQLKADWLASKDKIREELPYIEESDE